ncbi:site-specific DNA-methyltransferase [Pseudobutyrivibrio ruminis]|uniref:Adenine-specific DNA-methyltransferase n=1 Tax=Pseudobutyrivibrio ruminis DSM 9787 TaxID=1123011 RepID=A0A285RRQ0_9FIRM|nr:site-specific DNA-methyltransferase [Pseudobutyrivibrio ruminis]SOB96554.1 adenine-specific DNA-methyltransferase [Pseudobutyrivibrio ruminis DSM 9787]
MENTRLQLEWFNKSKALIPIETGKYGYTWVEPSDPRYCETHTIVLDDYYKGIQLKKDSNYQYSEMADLLPQSDNLLIQGESGDVLEALTRVPEYAAKYVGKVKLIYIDPPFNTSQTFESYEDNLEHSIWLTMMRDRLLHLKKLLAKDGSIWVHLDNVEVHRMRILLDEIFEPQNFVMDMQWEKKYGASNNSHTIASMTDTILVYRKSTDFSPNRLPRTNEMNARYSNPDNDPLGKWKVGDATARHNIGRQQHPSVYGFQNPFTGEIQYPSNGANWYFKRETVKEFLEFWGEYIDGPYDKVEEENRRRIEGNDAELRSDIKPLILKEWNENIGKQNIEKYNKCVLPQFTPTPVGGAILKVYLSEVSGRVPVNLLPFDEVGHNDSAKKEIMALFPDEKPFSTPKPERLLERIITIATNPGDIVLDCFAGSGTTAAVAQKMGRRWVTCELKEHTFSHFVLPRLKKVVMGEDMGGITRTKGERVFDESVTPPEGISVDDAATFTKVLNRIIAENENFKSDSVVRELKRLTKTKRTKEVLNWRGGGGFQVAHLSPACFDYDEKYNIVKLTDEAHGELLIRSIAANLGYKLLEAGVGGIFDAYKGKSVLKVIEGVATPEMVDWLLANLDEEKTLMIASTGVMDGTREYLRKARKGSRILVIPDDIFCSI